MADFDTPFRRSELVGVFRWKSSLTDSLRHTLPSLFHACHEKQYRSFQRRDKLFLRSTFEVIGGQDECDTYECVWTSLQPWHETHGHNHFGPISVQLPTSVLDGRRFYVFKRQLGGWRHYYLVQRETKSPLFGSKHLAPTIRPNALFQGPEKRGRLDQRPMTQYEIVLTDSVELTNTRFIATDHLRCVSRRCGGTSRTKAKEALEKTLDDELRRLARRFPQFKRRILGALKLT